MKRLYKYFLVLFVLTMTAIMLLSITAVFENSVRIICFVAIIILCTIYLFCLRRFSNVFSDKNCMVIACTLLFMLLLIQIKNCTNDVFIPQKGDYEAIYTAIKEVVSFGKLTDRVYPEFCVNTV